MRVTQQMLDRDTLHSISWNLDRLSKLNEQLSTGRRVNTISDDVPAARQAMYLQEQTNRIEAHLSNLSDVDGVLSVATSSLEKVSEILSSVRQLAVQGATGTYTAEDRAAMAEGADGLLNTLLSIANTEYNEAYLFGGQASQTVPYNATTDANGQITGVTYDGAAVSTRAPVGPGVTTQANLVGSDVFQSGADLFETVIGLRDALRANDVDEVTRLVGELETCHDAVRRNLGQLGGRQSQLDQLRTATEALRDLNTNVISERVDADVAELTIQFNNQMALLNIVLKVAAEAVKPTLASFL